MSTVRQDSSDVFSTYVRTLAADEAPEAQPFEQVWNQLRALLMRELRRRGLWDASPAHLGIIGHQGWNDEAVDEFVADCYSYIFIDRLRSLIAQARIKPDIAGLVIRNTRNFLYDRQRQHDPLGFRIFNVLRSRVQQAVERGALFVLEGDLGIRGEALLGFSTAAAAPEPSHEALIEIARAWNDDLLPELITANGRQWSEFGVRITACLVSLRDRGIEVFRFRQLTNLLIADARARWTALYCWSEESLTLEEINPVQSVRAVEDRDSFEQLAACVTRFLEDSPEKNRDLQTLWGFLVAHSADQLEAHDGKWSRLRLADFLGIPRGRLGELFETLGDLVQHCRQAISMPLNPRLEATSSQNSQRGS